MRTGKSGHGWKGCPGDAVTLATKGISPTFSPMGQASGLALRLPRPQAAGQHVLDCSLFRPLMLLGSLPAQGLTALTLLPGGIQSQAATLSSFWLLSALLLRPT